MAEWHRHGAHPSAQLAEADHVKLARDTFMVNLCSVAALTWVTYDLFLCFASEISVIWNRWYKRTGRGSRHAYVAVRYMSVVNLALFVTVNTSSNLSAKVLVRIIISLSVVFYATNTQNSCNGWYYVVVVNTALVTLLPDVIMLIRINAAHNWAYPYLCLTVGLFLIQLATSIGVGSVYIASSRIEPPLGALPIPGCRVIASSLPPSFTLAAWLPSILAHCVYFSLMFLTFIKVLFDLGQGDQLTRQSWRDIKKLIPTMILVVRHGFIYFSIAISTKVANAVILLTFSGPLQGIGIPWMMALYPIVITRSKLALDHFLHYIKPTSLLPPPDPHTDTASMVYSFIQPSLHWEDGPITFAPRASLTYSNASRMGYSITDFE